MKTYPHAGATRRSRGASRSTHGTRAALSCPASLRGPVVAHSRTAGERGERSEAGQGLAAVTHKIDQFSLHTASGKAGIAGTG